MPCLSVSSLSNLVVIKCYLLTGSARAFLSCVINVVACMMHVSILSSIPCKSGPTQGFLLLQGPDPLPLLQFGDPALGFSQVPGDNVDSNRGTPRHLRANTQLSCETERRTGFSLVSFSRWTHRQHSRINQSGTVTFSTGSFH